MSKSKTVMAGKLARVQESLMKHDFNSTDLDEIAPIILQECLRENMTFWFSFIENTCILNLRDTVHENYELNIRLHTLNPTDNRSYEFFKEQVLINTFLLTPGKTIIAGSDTTGEKEVVISNDKPVPVHIRKAIETIESKGIPVTREAIHNHLPLGEMSTSSRLECTQYLKTMEVQG